jgi:hypothetical protein
MDDDKVLYSRVLPGGGIVTVEADPFARGDRFRAQLRVERRSDRIRRDGHTPPIIAVAEGASYDSAFAELFAIAKDNVSIARCLLRWQSERQEK